jgi:hypothetical protein
MPPIDTYLAELNTRKQALQIQLNGINTQMANIRAHYSQSRSNLISKPSRHSKDQQLRKLQPIKEQLQAEIQALIVEIARIQEAKAQGFSEKPVEEAEIELICTRCTQGKLIITNNRIMIELSGFGRTFKSQILLRSSLASVESKVAVMSLFGMGGGVNLIFYGKGGEVLNANLVSPKDAKEIITLLN